MCRGYSVEYAYQCYLIHALNRSVFLSSLAVTHFCGASNYCPSAASDENTDPKVVFSLFVVLVIFPTGYINIVDGQVECTSEYKQNSY